MKKNILVTSALAGSLMFLGSNAIAQTKIDGTLVLGYKSISYDLAASQKDGMRGVGREAQLERIQKKQLEQVLYKLLHLVISHIGMFQPTVLTVVTTI